MSRYFCVLSANGDYDAAPCSIQTISSMPTVDWVAKMAFISPVASTVLSLTAFFEGDAEVVGEVRRRYAEYALKDFYSWYGVPAGIVVDSIREMEPIREFDPDEYVSENERISFGTTISQNLHGRLSAASFVSRRPMYSIVEEALEEKLSEIEEECKERAGQ